MRQAMNRIFLAILALFAGIAAQVVPAEARVRGETEIGATLGQQATVRAAASISVAAALQPAAGLQTAVPGPRPAAIRLSGFTAKTVQIGPDRARE